MMHPARKIWRNIAYSVWKAGRDDPRAVAGHPHLVTGLDHAQVDASCRLVVEDPDAVAGPRIIMQPGSYLGRDVTLAALAKGAIEIGTDTSLQDGCLIGGDVHIGAHCLFGRNVVVSSTSHRFRDRPGWLIRDQDRLSWETPDMLESPRSRRIMIEEDCWIGQGVVINPGITIGRGAIIGANAVVTRDVPPYAIVGGIPAKSIGHRLEFTPPRRIDPASDAHLPYFYRGFALAQRTLSQSRAAGGVLARGNACLVLAQGGQLQLVGRSEQPQSLIIAINGNAVAPIAVQGDFQGAWKIAPATESSLLWHYTVVEISASQPWTLTAAEALA